MAVKRFYVFFILFFIFGIAGCKTHAPKPTVDSFQPVVIKGPYIQRTDHVMFILDSSLSMATNMYGENKLAYAKKLLNRINQTMPKMHIKSALRTFGNANRPAEFRTDLVYGPAPHSSEDLSCTINTINRASGMSALPQALLAVKDDFKDVSGHISIIVVTDGELMRSPTKRALLSLKEQFKQQFSLYPIVINSKNNKVMREMTKIAEQGFVAHADDIFSPENMATYVNKVFLSRIRHKDKDGDGIADDKDNCPSTPAGARVTVNGCWIIGNIHFNSDSWSVRAEMHPYLDEIVAILENNPNLWMEVQGHTDHTGTAIHNYELSKNRALAVMNYLIRKGISSDRLTSTGYGSTRPIESNKSESGKALNRRVELKPIQK
ncbi:flagellar motor protein MotB [Candidatus Magnetomorum sp. HK-1]|nr:flagellar motor protein MotB [Candidatus Magnetomorum sp. HK-1]